MNNIILSGTMRSGTTLMASILNAHPKIDIVSDTLTWFYKRCFYQYGPMNSIYELDNALYEMEPYMLHHKNKYTIDELRKKVINKGISYESLYESLIELELNKNILDNYGIKTTHAAYKYEQIIEKIPTTKIIHMVRDVTDVYYSHKNYLSKGNVNLLSKFKTSIKKKICRKLLNQKVILEERIFYPYHFNEPKHIVDYWYSSNKLALDLKEKYPNNFLIIKYEDFIINIDKKMKEVSEFLSVPWVDDFYQYDNLQDRNNNKWKDNSSFATKNKVGYDQSKIGRGKNKLSKEELKYIDNTCHNILEKLEYEI